MKVLKKLHLTFFLQLATGEKTKKNILFSTMGSVSKIAPKIAQTPLQVNVPFVGTANLYLKTPDTMQKTRN